MVERSPSQVPGTAKEKIDEFKWMVKQQIHRFRSDLEQVLNGVYQNKLCATKLTAAQSPVNSCYTLFLE